MDAYLLTPGLVNGVFIMRPGQDVREKKHGGRYGFTH